MIQRMRFSILLLISVLLFQGCYSLKNVSIPPEWNSFYIPVIDNISDNVVPLLDQNFTEQLKDKIINESRLSFDDVDPDIELRGTITNFDVTAEAPQANATTSFNRLEIKVAIEFISNKNEEENWKRNFSWFSTFDANVNLLDVQDALIEEISEKIIEDIFNAAFSNW